MLLRSRFASLLLATSAIAWSWSADAGETTTYVYDVHGRLTKVSQAGTVNDGTEASYGYDAADNRSNVTVSVGAPPPPPPPSPPPPPPPPPPGNQPPVAVNDGDEISRCAYRSIVAVLENDYDPDGNTPLTLLGVSYSGGLGTAANFDPRIFFTPNDSGTGTAAISYTVADSLGATATGTLTLNVIQGQCP